MEEGKNINMANKIGICNKVGIHPLKGLTPTLLYNSMGFTFCCLLRRNTFVDAINFRLQRILALKHKICKVEQYEFDDYGHQ